MSPPKFVCSNFLSGNYVEIVYHFKGTSISSTVKWKRLSNLIKIQIRKSKRLKSVTVDFEDLLMNPNLVLNEHLLLNFKSSLPGPSNCYCVELKTCRNFFDS